MTNTPYVRAALAQAALDFVPPLIRLALVDNTEFKDKYRLSAEVELALGDSGIPIQRSTFFDAVRQALASQSAIEMTDIRGGIWQLTNQAEAGDLPKLVLSSGEQKQFLPDLAVLSSEPEVRLRSIDTVAGDVNLPTSAQDTWRQILIERAFEDHEVDQFRNDVHATPVHVAAMIRRQLKQGNASVSSLVPSSLRYFERLVGVYDGSTSILAYASGAGKDVLGQVSAWKPREGFMLSLFLSSHAALTAKINLGFLEKEDIVQCYEYLVTHGDVISRLGAIEVGLRVLPENREIEPLVVQLIEHIRDDDIHGTNSSFKLFAGLFVLVDGELSRKRLMYSTPPFYRRMASLSHAALIHRQLLLCAVDYEQLYNWALNSGAEQYYMQSLTDMRVEPRWNPEMASPQQLRAEFLSRIVLAASASEIKLRGTNLHHLILSSDPGSLSTLGKDLGHYLPGPLEGSEVARNTLPADLAEMIEADVTHESVEPSSFIVLVNSAMIFGSDSRNAELAANALRLGKHRLRNVESKSELLAVLMGLARVAAVARSTTLADELRILTRTYDHSGEYSLSIHDKLQMGLLAAASRADIMEWKNFVGEWLTELAFGELGVDEAKVLHSRLQCLCHAVPQLWMSCGRADAALIAFNGS